MSAAVEHKLFVIGGRDYAAWEKTLEILDLHRPGARWEWEPLPDTRQHWRCEAAAVVLSGVIYVVGGRGDGTLETPELPG